MIFTGGLGVAVAFAATFAGQFRGPAGVAWVAAGYLVLASVFAFLQSPYAAMPAELTTDSAERTRLMSWRVAGIALTTLVAGAAAPAVLVLPVLIRFGAGADKRRGVLVSSVVYLVASVAFLAVPFGAPVLVLAIALGCANAVQDTFVLSMLPDCIEADTVRTGRRQAGVFAGLFSGMQGLGFAVGPLLLGLVLQVGGYRSSDTGVAAAQSGSAATAVLVGVAVLPAVLTVLSLATLRRR